MEGGGYMQVRAGARQLFLDGLGSSGRLVGTISTCPGTYQCPWSLVMVKNPGTCRI